MDPSQVLPAPPAAVMAAITQAVFHQNLPWNMVLIGVLVSLSCVFCNHFLSKRGIFLSVLGMAIGMYLPLASSTPIFIGGFIALLVRRRLDKMTSLNDEEKLQRTYRGTLLACGLLAGAALMDVFLAVPFSLAGNPDILSLVPARWETSSVILSLLATLLLGSFVYRSVCKP